MILKNLTWHPSEAQRKVETPPIKRGMEFNPYVQMAAGQIVEYDFEKVSMFVLYFATSISWIFTTDAFDGLKNKNTSFLWKIKPLICCW